MILITRLNKKRFFVNEDKIEFIEETPDTIISLESGQKLAVAERASEIVELIRAEKQRIMQGKLNGYTPHRQRPDGDE